MDAEKKQSFTRRITQANRTQLVVIVYEMLLVYLEDASHAFEKSDKAEFKENLRMARECIGQMRTSLNFEYSLSKNLFAIYNFADKELARNYFSFKNDNIDVIQMIFRKLHNAYYKISKEDDSKPLMDNIQSVYAGLTYTKSTLNESIDYEDKKRGYFV